MRLNSFLKEVSERFVSSASFSTEISLNIFSYIMLTNCPDEVSTARSSLRLVQLSSPVRIRYISSLSLICLKTSFSRRNDRRSDCSTLAKKFWSDISLFDIAKLRAKHLSQLCREAIFSPKLCPSPQVACCSVEAGR